MNGTSVQCFMLYTSAAQVAAILPSSTPVGTGTISVSYNGAASATAPITVVGSSFGIFTINQQGTGQAVIQDGKYSFNAGNFAFQPGETVVVWGTGLGPIAGSDATTPPTGNLPGITVSVTVGGTPATVTYSGRSGYSGDDQIAFTIPSGVSGCFVPLAVLAGATGTTEVTSNYTTIAIGPTTTCTSPNYPPGFVQTLNSGAQTVRVGTILLTRTTSPTATSDSGLGIFDKVTTSNVSSSVTYDTNVGTCYLTSTHPASGTVTETPLDAGPELTITGPSGTMQMPEAGGNPGTYQANLGASSPLPGQGAKPPYLSPGAYTVSNGSGGADVGSFSGTVTKQPDFTWTNEGQITSVNRSQPLTVNGPEAIQLLSSRLAETARRRTAHLPASYAPRRFRREPSPSRSPFCRLCPPARPSTVPFPEAL